MNIFWFRRDLRLNDNAGLYHALKESDAVLPVFIFDSNILSRLSNKNDKRVQFIYESVIKIKEELQKMGSDLKVYHGDPLEIYQQIIEQFHPNCIYTNRDYEPYAKERDGKLNLLFERRNIGFKTFKDHCIFEFNEVLKEDGTPYTVFTPYSKKWLTKLTDFYLKSYPNSKYFNKFIQIKPDSILSMEMIGFESIPIEFPSIEIPRGIIKNYENNRDFPSIAGTSKLSLHFRFGTISIREKAASGKMISAKWLNELIWRDFYIQILAHFPHVVKGAFKPAYDKILWRNNEHEFQMWCDGNTGYPIVDAGMRELNATGFMHNRVRMIVSSFLTKHLLIDWRWGEAYFAERLLDFELASNNGGWQWAAGSGVDAAPYFRVFNPYLQTERFDPEHLYIKKWVPEFENATYPLPIVEHTFARDRCLAIYKEALTTSVII